MPIKPENKERYPENWSKISLEVRDDAGWRCECQGECGHEHRLEMASIRCKAEQDEPHPVTGSRVVLTVAHLDHQPENCERSNLRALCQRCHLAYDKEQHALSRAETKRKKEEAAGQSFLFGGSQ